MTRANGIYLTVRLVRIELHPSCTYLKSYLLDTPFCLFLHQLDSDFCDYPSGYDFVFLYILLTINRTIES